MDRGTRFDPIAVGRDAADATIRVLIADDVVEIRDLLETALSREEDFEVVGTAGDGIQAIAGARETRPDVVLLDLAMPERDGIDTLPELRRTCPDALIMVLSGFAAARMSRIALERGADGYLEKGISTREITELIRRRIDERAASSG